MKKDRFGDRLRIVFVDEVRRLGDATSLAPGILLSAFEPCHCATSS